MWWPASCRASSAGGTRRAWRTAAASVMQPIVRLMGPIPAVLLATGRVLGRRQRADGPSGEEEDLRGLVDLLERRRVIEPGERAMIHSVFELGDTIVREVMVPRTEMIFVESGKTLRQALSLALRSGFSRIPVVGENLDDVIGIAYLKDIVTRGYEYSDGAGLERVDSIMRPATFVPDSKPVDDLLREMQARQTHVAIVIDEYGGTAGLVTIEDILEEIVGEIADEYDQERPPVEWLGDGYARVTARLSVDELAELFGVQIEAEDVETVGGLLAQRLGRVPIAGLDRDGGWTAPDGREPGRPAEPDQHRDRRAGQPGRAAACGRPGIRPAVNAPRAEAPQLAASPKRLPARLTRPGAQRAATRDRERRLVPRAAAGRPRAPEIDPTPGDRSRWRRRAASACGLSRRRAARPRPR